MHAAERGRGGMYFAHAHFRTAAEIEGNVGCTKNMTKIRISLFQIRKTNKGVIILLSSVNCLLSLLLGNILGQVI